MTVLILSGNESFGEQLRAFARDQLGCGAVGLASDADAALDLAQVTRPDFALIDAELPGRTGFETARRLIELDAAARVVLMGTGEPDEYIRVAAEDPGFDYLPKTAISRRLPLLMGIQPPESVLAKLKRTASPGKLILEGATGGAALTAGLALHEPVAAFAGAAGIVLLSRWHSFRVPRLARPAGSTLAPATAPRAVATERPIIADGVRGSPERRSGNGDSF